MPALSLGMLLSQQGWRRGGSGWEHWESRGPWVPHGAAWMRLGVAQTHHLITSVGFAHSLANSSIPSPACGSLMLMVAHFGWVLVEMQCGDVPAWGVKRYPGWSIHPSLSFTFPPWLQGRIPPPAEPATGWLGELTH